jgi:DNA-binding beta-propeller fold protein YncE
MIASTLFLTLASLLPTAAPSADFHVAPNGNDSNPGTEAAPFASIAAARDAVRKLVSAGLKKDIRVLIAEGTYEIPETLKFTPEDSGTAEHAITYEAQAGKKVVLSGGRSITGWTRGERDRWTVEIPEVKAGSWRFRQLFADGVRLPRARFPNGDGLLRVKEVSKDVKQITLASPLPFGSLEGRNAELVMFQNWSISRDPIVSLDKAVVNVLCPMGWIGHGEATTASAGKPCYLENAPEFLDRPDEWYLDTTTGVLTCMARPNQDLKTRVFIAPRLSRLIEIAGRPNQPVRNLHFKGLTFAYTEWTLPGFGYMGIQAGHHGTSMDKPTYVLPAAIHFDHAAECRLDRCRILHTGASGVAFGPCTRQNRLIGCEVSDTGGNGILIGWRGQGPDHIIAGAGDESLSADWKNPADAPAGNEVSNCVVHNCATVNHGCVGIGDLFSAGSRISHNLVTDMPYTGISVGFRWDSSPTSQRDTAVEYNRIHDCMKKLADGGGIYTLGLQPGTVLRGNVIYNIHRSGYAQGGAPNNGIFFDQGTKDLLIEGQIIFYTSGEPIRFNQTEKGNMTWKDNSFGVIPTDAKFPAEAAKKAGPLPEYQDMMPNASAGAPARPRLLISLPVELNTPDGMRLNPKTGEVIVSCPNFNDPNYPARLITIKKDNTWEVFYDKLPVHPGTGKACPMGLDFGPDGHLYYADNQYFYDKNHASRLIRIRIENGKPVGADVAVDGFKLSNAVMWKGNSVYVSDTYFDLPDKPGTSGIYRFTLKELNQGTVTLKPKGQDDQHLLVELHTQPLQHRHGELAGADGITFDSKGNLYTGNFGDGQLFRIRFNKDGSVKAKELVIGPPKLTCVDGLTCDPWTDRIYVADSERNAIQVVTPDGAMTTLWENADTDGANGLLDQPCETVVRGKDLIIANFDMPFPGVKNSKFDRPYTISIIRLE